MLVTLDFPKNWGKNGLVWVLMPEFHLALVSWSAQLELEEVFCEMQFLSAESCTSELQPHLCNTNHLFIPHFLACSFHMEAIRTHVLQCSALLLLLGFILCPYSEKMSSSSSIWKKKRYLKQSLLVAELTEQQKHNKQQAQPTTALLVHGTIPAFCQWENTCLFWSCWKNTCLEPSQLVLVHHLRAVLQYGTVQLLEMANVGFHYVLHFGFVLSYDHSEIT